MRYLAVAVILSSLAPAAFAQQATCKLQSVEQKLTGAPLVTFIQKSEGDAQKACEQLTSARHLEEPAKTLFVNNCARAFTG